MKFNSFNGLPSLKDQQVTVDGSIGTIVDIGERIIYIRDTSDNRIKHYSIELLKNKTIKLNDPDTENAMLLSFRKDELNSSVSPLFNKNVELDISEEVQKIVLDEWRLTAESAMQVSTRRQSANNLFITILTILIGGILFSDGFIGANKPFQLKVAFIVSVLGIIICCEWVQQLKDYGRLNDIKYSAIRDMEKYLPVQYFNAETVYFYDNYISQKSFSGSEKRIPIYFCVTFILIAVMTVGSLRNLNNNTSYASITSTENVAGVMTESEAVHHD